MEPEKGTLQTVHAVLGVEDAILRGCFEGSGAEGAFAVNRRRVIGVRGPQV